MRIFTNGICTMLILSIMYLAVPSVCLADTANTSTGTTAVTTTAPGYDDDD